MILPMNTVLSLNIVSVVVFLFFIINGYSRGFIHQILDLIGFIASFVVAWIFAPQIADSVPLLPSTLEWFNTPIIGNSLFTISNTILWFVIIMIGISVVMTFIVKPFAKGIHAIPIAKTLNRLLGAIYGLIPASLLAILTVLILTSPLFQNGRSTVESSILKPYSSISDVLLDGFFNRNQESTLLHKILNGEPITTQDLQEIPSWFTQMGLPENLKGPMEKLINGEPLNTDELSAITTYIKEQQWSTEDLVSFLKSFGLNDEQISNIISVLN